MQLKSLSIEGFRGFKDRQEIIFPENGEPLVILGVNGAGKTAVLEAIRAAIAPFVLDLDEWLSSTFFPYKLQLSPIKYEHEWLLNQLEKELGLRFSVNDIYIKAQKSLIELRWEILGKEFKDKSFLRRYKDQKVFGQALWDRKSIHFLHEDKKSKLPVISYYASDRNIRESSLASLEEASEMSLYTNALTTGPVDFKRFFSWYRFTEDIENEQRLGQEDFSYKHPQLEAVRQAIIQMMGDEFKDLRIQRSPYIDMILKKQGAQLSVMQLSSGEKALLALAGDLAMRLALANEGEEHPLRGAGVVMIDEIDLHLHPSWQRKVVSRLQQTFPNVQFILTTHSPLVINHLKAESLYLLKDNQCFPVIDFNPYGADIETVLAWQGLSPEEIQGEVPLEGISKTLQLIQDNQLQKAKEEIVKLKKEMDKEHPKIKALESQIEIKEMLNGMDL
ncbi:putative ATP-binding protein involved in virulence [Saprospira grandis DSM 2844]|uniref:Putative ATP-binding protein involved in virulence n=1 Tax=Saprospira grandis DSM 2844 TaxID=694433 RepID=J0Y0E1_9BACT|nr:AAA family ATPase [Saprospira grandis]EJF54996.1 putative ATP-binding protein involved in virulence [Saprospira grandis DSM 2844]